jgi:hypothetical protein
MLHRIVFHYGIPPRTLNRWIAVHAELRQLPGR